MGNHDRYIIFASAYLNVLLMRTRLLSILIFVLSGTMICNGQADTIRPFFPEADTLSEYLGLFEDDDLFTFSLKFDITEYRKTKSDEEYLDAELWYVAGGDSIKKKVKVRSRGEFRRKFCEMPPLMLNFRSRDSAGVEFLNINKLKMVTECPTGNQEYLLKEYLVYRMYNIITENSYRVRLLRVNYINSAKNNRVATEYAFVIEPDEMLANRIGAYDVRTTNLTQKNVKPEMMDRFAVFNYMIGNTDWSVPIGHNIKMFAQPRSERPDLAVIVPYDFDFSGIVNTHYSSPFHNLSISSVRERLYLGMCRSREDFVRALMEFPGKKNELYSLISEFPYLNQRSKDDMILFLDGFFEEIKKPESLARTLLRECLRF
jgi:hypothetical protein